MYDLFNAKVWRKWSDLDCTGCSDYYRKPYGCGNRCHIRQGQKGGCMTTLMISSRFRNIEVCRLSLNIYYDRRLQHACLFRNPLYEIIKQISRVFRPWAGFRMELNGEPWLCSVLNPFHRSVIRVTEPHLPSFR